MHPRFQAHALSLSLSLTHTYTQNQLWYLHADSCILHIQGTDSQWQVLDTPISSRTTVLI